MFVSGMNPFAGQHFALGTLIITVPIGDQGVQHARHACGAATSATTHRRCCSRSASSRCSCSGGLGRLFLGNATADMQLHDTYFVVGHFHMMIGGVTLMATFARDLLLVPEDVRPDDERDAGARPTSG